LTIQVELSAEVEARLTAQATARRMDVPAYAAVLLEEASLPEEEEELVRDRISQEQPQNPRKSLAQLFSESPFRGLDLEFERDRDFGPDLDL
jgi:hypothetical protein